jgi:hypothetical protein
MTRDRNPIPPSARATARKPDPVHELAHAICAAVEGAAGCGCKLDRGGSVACSNMRHAAAIARRRVRKELGMPEEAPK